MLRGTAKIWRWLFWTYYEPDRGTSRRNVTVEWPERTAISFSLQLLPSFSFIVVGLMLTGVVVTLAQTQFLWAGKKIGFDFKRLNPLEGFKRIFSSHGFFEVLRSLLKLGWVSWIAYGFLRSSFVEMIAFNQFDLPNAVSKFAEMCISLTSQVIAREHHEGMRAPALHWPKDLIEWLNGTVKLAKENHIPCRPEIFLWRALF
ncbi:EscU/YscU/HrcU family type III secretion system export apparatus switch protein [Candidatus Villigracilis saccharophilus]|uniref:EscU/YscU/HrcU family type III secretion system export apparatus switch protein n=1 Tax=Candidatus Villigracilis saccharophilus TaxID=3140684 RepID=UPI003136C8F9|nr:EscU/YscU/HrcU family type III secretion system export apparatus switch protein [Anaerolineales bacterium]